MKVELTEDQIGLLKACTAAQQQLLRREAKDYPSDRRKCWDQIKECTNLHGVLTLAQSKIRETR